MQEYQNYISIIIPIYQAETHLYKCIDSILSQKHIEYELILVNDGSNDKSPQICNEYATKYPQIKVIHKKNGGPSSARNIGLEYAKGDYITFIDADDYVSPYFLYDLINGQKKHNSDLTICGYYKETPEKKIKYKFDNIHLSSKKLNTLFTHYNLLSQCYSWNKLFKHEIIKKYNLRFNPDISLAEDAIFLFQYLLHVKSVQLIDKENYYYQIVNDSNSLMHIKRSSNERRVLYHHYSTSIKKLAKYINDKNTTNIFYSQLANIIENIIISLYHEDWTSKERIEILKKLDLEIYSRHKKTYTYIEYIITCLLKYRLYNLYDWIMDKLIYRNE